MLDDLGRETDLLGQPSHKSLLRKTFHFSLWLFFSPNDNIFISFREGFFCVWSRLSLVLWYLIHSLKVFQPQKQQNSTARVKHQQSKHHIGIVSQSQTTTENFCDLQTRGELSGWLAVHRKKKYKKFYQIMPSPEAVSWRERKKGIHEGTYGFDVALNCSQSIKHKQKPHEEILDIGIKLFSNCCLGTWEISLNSLIPPKH